jgi:large subunit ribosomal protein L19
MNQEIIAKKEAGTLVKRPKFDVGDTISINTIVREGEKKRTQIFKGLVIAIKGSGVRKTFTVRKISAGVGVEKILPYNSPNVGAITIVKKGDVRKSKLYYMRKRIGKKALKVKDGIMVPEETVVQPEVVAEVEAEVSATVDETTEAAA